MQRSRSKAMKCLYLLPLMLLAASLLVSVEAFQPTQPRAIRSPTNTMVMARKATRCSRQDDTDDKQQETSRRQVMSTIISSLVVASTLQQDAKPANAYTREFPVDLDFENGDTSRDLTALRVQKIQQKKENTKKSMDYVKADPLTFRGPKDLLTTTVWGGALWFLSGSRSNAIVTPLANALYDEDEEEWLKDRNEGLFASVPLYLFFVLSAVFFFLGVIMDRIILLATEGDANVSLQLAGVSLIAGGSLELGRIFSGEKGMTRQETDREAQLEQEFAEFAENRLIKGGNCHRSEVVKAFRRYYAKYRQADDSEYPLNDLEIERLLRSWCRRKGNAEMSSAGFFTGIQINEQADVFVSQL